MHQLLTYLNSVSVLHVRTSIARYLVRRPCGICAYENKSWRCARFHVGDIKRSNWREVELGPVNRRCSL